MFGYIKTDTPELKVRDYEIYKGVYCSICRTLGKRYGVFARMLLSYDCTFLALFLMSQENECSGFENMRCPFNPVKKCKKIKNKSEALDFSADISVLLAFYKLKDSIEDSSFFFSLFFRLLTLFMLPYYKKAKKYRFEADKIIGEYIKAQFVIEKEKSSDIDSASEPTGQMLSDILLLAVKKKEKKDNICRLGYLVGRWIYLIDAFDDMEKDSKKGNYNVFNLLGNTDKTKIEGDILMTAGEAYREFKNIEFYKFKDIIENIIKDGLYKETVNIAIGGGHGDRPLQNFRDKLRCKRTGIKRGI